MATKRININVEENIKEALEMAAFFNNTTITALITKGIEVVLKDFYAQLDEKDSISNFLSERKKKMSEVVKKLEESD